MTTLYTKNKQLINHQESFVINLYLQGGSENSSRVELPFGVFVARNAHVASVYSSI